MRSPIGGLPPTHLTLLRYRTISIRIEQSRSRNRNTPLSVPKRLRECFAGQGVPRGSPWPGQPACARSAADWPSYAGGGPEIDSPLTPRIFAVGSGHQLIAQGELAAPRQHGPATFPLHPMQPPFESGVTGVTSRLQVSELGAGLISSGQPSPQTDPPRPSSRARRAGRAVSTLGRRSAQPPERPPRPRVAGGPWAPAADRAEDPPRSILASARPWPILTPDREVSCDPPDSSATVSYQPQSPQQDSAAS